MRKKAVAKSARKSVRGRPFAKGGDPRQGRGPAPGTGGRPPDAFKRRAQELANGGAGARHSVLEFWRRVRDGDEKEIVVTKDGDVLEVNPDIRTRLDANKMIAAYAEGLPGQSLEIKETTHEDALDQLE